MEINDRSPLDEVLQAVSGTWDISTSNGWKCLESGKMKLYKKLVSGQSPLPDQFINQRSEITPYWVFHKNSMEGGIILLQDTAITANGLVVILQF